MLGKDELCHAESDCEDGDSNTVYIFVDFNTLPKKMRHTESTNKIIPQSTV